MLIMPSYKQGFARSAAESANPGLWEDLQGAWSPSLGPSGETLFDVSAYKKPGTLTSMEASTDWERTNKRGLSWALDLDGTNDEIDIGISSRFAYVANPRTFSTWVNVTAFDTGFNRCIASLCLAASGQNGRTIYVNAEDNAISVAFEGHRVVTPSVLSTSVWYFVVIRIPDGSTTTADLEIWIDGVNQVLSDEAGSSQTLDTNGPIDLHLGARDTSQFYFSGKISNSAYWNRSLTTKEIQLLFHHPSAIVQHRDSVFTSEAEEAVSSIVNPYYYQHLLAG